MNQDYAGVVENNDFRYTIADGQEFGTILQAQFLLASNNQAESFEYKDVTYDLTLEGPDFYTISSNGTILAIAAKDIINSESGEDFSFNVKLEALRAYTNGKLLLAQTARTILWMQMATLCRDQKPWAISAALLYLRLKMA